MSHVAGICTAPIVAEIRSSGRDPQTLIEGLGLDLVRLEDASARIPWSAFVPFAERASSLLGDEAIEDLAARATVHSVPDPIRRLLPRLTDSRSLFPIAARWWGPWVFNGTQGVCERLPDGRLRERIRIRDEHEACPAFLVGLKGTLRAMPRLTGQADALVELDHDGREGEFLITPPPRVRLRDRLFGRTAKRKPVDPVRELEAFGFTQEAILTNERSLHLAVSELARERGERSTLERLSRLVLTSDVARPTELASDIVALLLERDDVVGAQLSFPSSTGEGKQSVTGGRLGGLADRARPLMIGDREVGHIALWAALEGDDLASVESLEQWVGVALEFGRLRATNAELRRMLAENVVDWQGMESRLEGLFARFGLDVPRD